MILQKSFSNKNLPLLANFVFAFLPISFILGNLVTNINLVFFCFLGIFILRSNMLSIKLDLILKIVFLFFLVIFLSTSFSFIKSIYFEGEENIDFTRLIKSILFFRFFIFILIVYFLSELNIINFKYFFIIATFSSLLISLDVIYQYSFGFNIVGLKSFEHHNTSFFGDELISGGFIRNFSFFSILFLSYFFRNNNNFIKIPLIVISICILASGIIFSGNRMPIILFLFGLALLYFINKNLRKTVFASILALSVLFGFIISYDRFIKVSYQSLYENSVGLIVSLSERIISDEKQVILKEKNEFLQDAINDAHGRGTYKKIMLTGIDTWKMHKIFGNGIKSFREDCQKVIAEKKIGLCSNHPHNYYLEILTDLGIIGFIFVLIIGLIFIFFLIKNLKFLNKKNIENLFLIASIISLTIELFPIKSSGSIFTTNNATYIALLSSIVLSRKQLLKDKNFN